MILRPLLQNLKGIILLWGDHVDVQNISWKDIITLSEKVMDDRDAARLHFI